MAKIKKRKLCWEASGSPQVIGYKLYWAEGDTVDYNSHSTTVGNVTEVVLPDDLDGFEHCDGPLVFGLTALDELGNESDIITLDVPYQFNVPKMPEDLWIETLEEFFTSSDQPDMKKRSGPIPLFDESKVHGAMSEAESIASESQQAKGSLKYIRGNDAH